MTLVLVWAGLGAYRVYEIPRPEFVDDLAAAREAHGVPITPEEGQTATLYRQAFSSINWGTTPKGNMPDPGEKSAIHGWNHATDFEQRAITENQDPLRQIMALTARPACAFNDPSRSNSGRDQVDEYARQAGTLLLLSARKLEAEDNLDEALNRYIAVLRLGRHVAYRGDTGDWYFGTGMASMVNQWIPLWAAHAEQTPTRIETGIRRIGEETGQFPSLRDAILTQQFMIRRAVRDDWSALLEKRQDKLDEARLRMELTALDRFCPWERARTMRVWDLVDAAQLHCLNVLDQALAAPGGWNMEQWAEMAGIMQEIDNTTQATYNNYQFNFLGNDFAFFAPPQSGAPPASRVPWNWLKTTYPLNTTVGPRELEWIWNARLRRVLSLRVMILRLKLVAFKQSHGEYPERFDQVVPGRAPIDPYTGAEFGYRRQGFPAPITALNGRHTLPRNRQRPAAHSVEAAGPFHAREFIPMAATTGMPEDIPHPRKSGTTSASALVFTLP